MSRWPVADQLNGVMATAGTSVKAETVVVYIGTDKGATIKRDVHPSFDVGADRRAVHAVHASDRRQRPERRTISSSGPDSVNGIPCVGAEDG